MTDDQIIARILEDAETTIIAEALGLEPADYAARVLHYIRNPNADPQLDVMDAAAEKEAGMPSVAECRQFLEKLEDGDEHEQTKFTGFDEDEKSAATLTGTGRKKGPQAAPPLPPVPGEETGSKPTKSRSGR
jgi:hypothetical protein